MKTIVNKAHILSRLKDVNNFTSDTELAKFLGINKSTLSNWYSRNTIDYDLVFSKCEHINLNWLITGQGEMLREITKTISPPQPSTVDIPIHQDLLTEKDERINELKDMITVQKVLIKNLEEKVKRMRDIDVDGDAECAAVG